MYICKVTIGQHFVDFLGPVYTWVHDTGQWSRSEAPGFCLYNWPRPLACILDRL